MEYLEYLKNFSYDEQEAFELRDRYKRGELSLSENVVRGTVEVPQEDDIKDLPVAEKKEYESLSQEGKKILKSGKLAKVELAGGVGIRFGRHIKAVYPIHEGKSFIELKLMHTASLEYHYKCKIYKAVLTSFATHEAVKEELLRKNIRVDRIYTQGVTNRLIPTVSDIEERYRGKIDVEQLKEWKRWAEGREGEFYYNPNHEDGYCPTGHFDAIAYLVSSGTLADMIKEGIEYGVFCISPRKGGIRDKLSITFGHFGISECETRDGPKTESQSARLMSLGAFFPEPLSNISFFLSNRLRVNRRGFDVRMP